MKEGEKTDPGLMNMKAFEPEKIPTEISPDKIASTLAKKTAHIIEQTTYVDCSYWIPSRVATLFTNTTLVEHRTRAQ